MGLDQSRASTTTATWAKGIFVGRDDVYVDGKLYDCPAPCLGISITTGEPVWNDLKQKYPATLTAGHRRSRPLPDPRASSSAPWPPAGGARAADRMMVGSPLMVSAVPDYVIVLLAWIYFSLQLEVFPNTGYYPITENPLKTVTYMMLPVAGDRPDQLHRLRPVHPRSDGGDPERGLHAHRPGQGPARCAGVLFKHALRAAIVPVITIFGLDFATLLARHDLHRADLQHRRHRPLGPAGAARPRSTSTSSARPCWSAAVLIVVANLVVDVVYGFLDPRVTVG